MKRWNKLSRKIPKINTYIYALHDSLSELVYGKLVVYIPQMDEEDGFFEVFYEDGEEHSHGFQEGDLFWMLYGDERPIDENVCWDTVENYPYWIIPTDLVQIATNRDELKEIEETDRFDILDIQWNLDNQLNALYAKKK